MKPEGSLSPRLSHLALIPCTLWASVSPVRGSEQGRWDTQSLCVMWRAESGVVGSVWSSLNLALGKPAQNYQILAFLKESQKTDFYVQSIPVLMLAINSFLVFFPLYT